MRTVLAVLAVVLFTLGCGSDGDTARDYSYSGACPAPITPSMFNNVATTASVYALCDEGVGYSPRFVTVETCAAEAGIQIPMNPGGFGVGRGLHPEYQRCFRSSPQVQLFTYEEVRTTLHFE